MCFLFLTYSIHCCKSEHQGIETLYCLNNKLDSKRYITYLDWIVCSLPPCQICLLKSSPSVYSVWRWDLWEVIRFRWGHEGGALIEGLVPLKEEMLELFLSPPWEGTKETVTVCKRALTRTWPWSLPDLILPVSRTVRYWISVV